MATLEVVSVEIVEEKKVEETNKEVPLVPEPKLAQEDVLPAKVMDDEEQEKKTSQVALLSEDEDEDELEDANEKLEELHLEEDVDKSTTDDSCGRDDQNYKIAPEPEEEVVNIIAKEGDSTDDDGEAEKKKKTVSEQESAVEEKEDEGVVPTLPNNA